MLWRRKRRGWFRKAFGSLFIAGIFYRFARMFLRAAERQAGEKKRRRRAAK